MKILANYTLPLTLVYLVSPALVFLATWIRVKGAGQAARAEMRVEC